MCRDTNLWIGHVKDRAKYYHHAVKSGNYGRRFEETGGSGNIGDKFTAEIETPRLTRISATEIDGLLCRDARQWDFDGIVYSGRKESGKWRNLIRKRIWTDAL